MKKLILFESILILFFVLAWNVGKAEEKLDFTGILDDNLDLNKEKRDVWIAECYLDARKDAEIVSDTDAGLVNMHCNNLGYDKYPK